MKVAKLMAVLFVVIVMFWSYCEAMDKNPRENHAAADLNAPCRFGVQCWSFKDFTFYEALDMTFELGLKCVEAYPGQKIGNRKPEGNFIHTMSPELRSQVRQKLAQQGIRLASYGVVDLPNDEAGCRQVFDFAMDMNIDTIVSEPNEHAFDMIDKLCQEYKINVAVHNHPKPSHYWDPNAVLKVCKDRSSRIGACADTGHWMRSGVDPLEAIKKLQGRIIEVHLKDLNAFGVGDAHDVPWGTGVANLRAILKELDRQNFAGAFLIEYEYNMKNSMPEIKECISFFKENARAPRN